MDEKPSAEKEGSVLNTSPELGMGCWALGGDYWSPLPGKITRKTLRTALKRGIRLYDTAPSYGKGVSEQLLGQSLYREHWKTAPGKREETTITTKFFPTLPENVYKGLKRSLSRLLTDYIDIYYIHWPNDKCDISGIMGELERAREEGLIKALGVSNFSVQQMEEAAGYGKIDFCQTGYSFLWRYPERELIPWCMKNDIKVVAYSPLAQGLLKNRQNPDIAPVPQDDSRRELIFFRDENMLRQTLNDLEAAALKEGISLTGAAMGWLFRKKNITGVLAGMRTPEQVDGILRYREEYISDSLIEKLDVISDSYCQKLISANPDAENIWAHRR